MDTNKKSPSPTLIFQKKITTPVRPPKTLNSLKNQHPSPRKKNEPSKSPRSGKIS